MTDRHKFDFFRILVIALMVVIPTISISSSRVAGGRIITNYAQAQGEVKVSIVPGASTLGDKAFSPNPVNIKVGDTVMWVHMSYCSNS